MGLRRTALGVLGAAIRGTLALSGRKLGALAQAELSKELVPIVPAGLPDGRAIRFLCPSETAVWRAQTFWSKEPETIAWIDGFGPDAVLWDIGANVGVYSLYAAAASGARVVAFEPGPANFFLLTRNIELNGLADRITPFCVPLGGTTGLGVFSMSSSDYAKALHGFASGAGPNGAATGGGYRQTVLGFTVDDFAERFAPPFPTHVKIDVDGIEGEIVAAAERTLAGPEVKSALIEMDSANAAGCEAVIECLARCGLALVDKTHSAHYDTGPHSGNYNYIFRRAESA